MQYTTSMYCILSIFMLIFSTGLASPIARNLNSQSRLNFGSLVPGVTHVKALPIPPPQPGDENTAQPMYLSMASQLAPGKLTLKQSSPSLFFISHEQLWVYANESYVHPVNVLNATIPGNLPLQMAVGNKVEGVTGGSWRWLGTMLFYSLGNRSNGARFHSCKDKDDVLGLYIFLDRHSLPPDCTTLMLQAYSSS
jgi:hypothetical protein